MTRFSLGKKKKPKKKTKKEKKGGNRGWELFYDLSCPAIHPGTETIRSCSLASKAFVTAWDNPAVSNASKATLLREATVAHSQFVLVSKHLARQSNTIGFFFLLLPLCPPFFVPAKHLFFPSPSSPLPRFSTRCLCAHSLSL
jgi:hypothetical protein